jgi:hypothetical protein
MAGTARDVVEQDERRSSCVATPIQRTVDISPANSERLGCAFKKRIEKGTRNPNVGVVDSKLGHVGQEAMSKVIVVQLPGARLLGTRIFVLCRAGTVSARTGCWCSVSTVMTDAKTISLRTVVHNDESSES